MKKLIILISQRCLVLILSCGLILGISSNFWLTNSISPFAYAETLTANDGLFSEQQTRQYSETMPYWIWLVLPRIFPEYLNDKGGFLSLGFQWLAGEETPVGIHKDNSNELEALSCYSCHIGTSSLLKKTSTVEGLFTPKVDFNHQNYHQFLVSCAKDPRFTADYILPAIEYNHQLSFFEKQYYRWLLIPKTQKQLLA
jgi:hypothetical protein